MRTSWRGRPTSCRGGLGKSTEAGARQVPGMATGLFYTCKTEEGVISATASYREGTAVVQTDGSASSDALGQAVEAADYKVLE